MHSSAAWGGKVPDQLQVEGNNDELVSRTNLQSPTKTASHTSLSSDSVAGSQPTTIQSTSSKVTQPANHFGIPNAPSLVNSLGLGNIGDTIGQTLSQIDLLGGTLLRSPNSPKNAAKVWVYVV